MNSLLDSEKEIGRELIELPFLFKKFRTNLEVIIQIWWTNSTNHNCSQYTKFDCNNISLQPYEVWIISWPRCEIFGFFLLSFPQNEKKMD